MDRYKLNSQIARYLVDNVGADLYQLHNEIEKLRTYVGDERPFEPQDVDVLILRSEQYGPFELDDAVLASDYKKAVQVVGTMLDEGVEPLVILARVARVWRQVRRKSSGRQAKCERCGDGRHGSRVEGG
jgi:DNA polymerase-3 subunit delta